MNFINTHSHVYTSKFAADRHTVIQRATDAGVSKILLPDIDIENRDDVFNTAAAYPDICMPMVGIHPTSVNENYQIELDAFDKAVSEKKVCAIGEIGLDLYWDKTFMKEQIIVFKHQVAVAEKLNLPIVIHVRDAFDEIFDTLHEIGSKKYRGVFHCFTGTEEQAVKAIEFGFYLGIGGVLTYKKSGLDTALANIDVKHMMLETDDPWLSPVPHRGKRNEPSYIVHVAEKLAEVKQVSVDKIAEITTQNAWELFKL